MSTAPQNNLGEEIRAALVQGLEGIAAKLATSVYSPRIKLLSVEAVEEITGMSGRTIDRMIADGKFPRPMKDMGKRTWRESTILAWMEAHDPDAHTDWAKKSAGEGSQG